MAAYDIDCKRVDLINRKLSPIKDNEIEIYLKEKELNLKCVTELEPELKSAEFIIIATPTIMIREKLL